MGSMALAIDRRHIEESNRRHQEREKQWKEHAAQTIRNFSLLSIEAKKIAALLAPESDIGKLVNELIEYIEKRSKEGFDLELDTRGVFIKSCLDAISKKDFATLDKLVKEENIKEFRGYISQRLYNLVKPFQFFSEKRREEKIKGINLAMTGSEGIITKEIGCCSKEVVENIELSYPKDILGLIDEYDQSFSEIGKSMSP
jgi:hypothetical protein